MSKVKPSTKEQLVYFLLQNISLGTYDKKFLNNLQTMHITPQKPVTSNQADLLNKITLRYFKQLKRKEIDANEMTDLSWGLRPVDSHPDYTDAFCTIKDNIIQVRSPYKKDFITDVKDTELHLNWDKETKLWSAPYCEVALKHFIDCLDKHYAVTHYCPKTTEIISTFADYESATCWDPTYKCINGNYVVAAINRHLAEAIENIRLDGTSASIARLHSAGIKIDEELITDKKLFEFVTSDRPVIDLNNVATLVNYLVDIECDYVIVCEAYRTGNVNLDELVTLLETKNIRHTVVDRKHSFKDTNLEEYDYPVVINTALWGIGDAMLKLRGCKVVHLGNSKLVDIK